MQPPPPAAVATLESLGFHAADPSYVHRCLRWHRGAGSGILYASHVPLPWGVYYIDEDGSFRILWGKRMDDALSVLALVSR
jgi:hypothetical protein